MPVRHLRAERASYAEMAASEGGVGVLFYRATAAPVSRNQVPGVD